MNTSLKKMKEELLRELENIAAYWEKYSWDGERRIFRTLGCDNLPLADGCRSAVLISRVLWAYSAAYRLTGNAHYLDLASSAFADITAHYLDEENGGIFEELNADGEPVKKDKRVYTQSYLIYAMAEYYRAPQDMEALSAALRTFEKIEEAAFDPEIGGYIAECTENWAPKKGVLTVDTYLHLTEAYTNLMKAYPDEYLKGRLQTILILLLTRFLRKDGALYQELQEDWSPTQDLSDRFADDAECCWMILEARDQIRDSSMYGIITEAAIRMMRHLAAEGRDPVYGGIYDRKNTDGTMSTDKMWWEESESVTGLLYAYRETVCAAQEVSAVRGDSGLQDTSVVPGDSILLETALETWHFMQKYILQPEQEWYWMVHDDGTKIPVEDPSRPLKCPYHSIRITVLCVPVLESLGI